MIQNSCDGLYRRVIEIKNLYGMTEGFLYYCSEPEMCLGCQFLYDQTEVTIDDQRRIVRYCRWRDGNEPMLHFPRKNWC